MYVYEKIALLGIVRSYRDPTSVGDGNELFFIRVWKPSISYVFYKLGEEARKGKSKEDNIC